MEQLVELEQINFPVIMLGHMNIFMTSKTVKHGIPFGYLLNLIFKHLEVTT